MVQYGIVEHGLSPFDVIQRAIDDTATDYILVRQRIDKDTNGDPTKLEDHPLYYFMEHIREASVRYSTFAMQYDIQRRQLKLSESRVALLAATLRTVATQLGLTPDQTRQIPKLLISTLEQERIKQDPPNPGRNAQPTRMDPNKAEAIAEILHHDSMVEVIEVEPTQS